MRKRCDFDFAQSIYRAMSVSYRLEYFSDQIVVPLDHVCYPNFGLEASE